jgi:hypothetical protein
MQRRAYRPVQDRDPRVVFDYRRQLGPLALGELFLCPQLEVEPVRRQRVHRLLARIQSPQLLRGGDPGGVLLLDELVGGDHLAQVALDVRHDRPDYVAIGQHTLDSLQ